jgi:hypothetical protein
VTTAAQANGATSAGVRRIVSRRVQTTWLIPGALFGVALVCRLLAAAAVRFPLTEGSAYYSTVAQNLATGRGLVVDAIWSYSTPPLTLPRPAFELWQPLASLMAALPMPLFGASFASAQLAYAIVGALLAPLTWYVARDAARRLHVPRRRATILSVGAGVLAAMVGPLVLAAAVPDSSLPYTVIAVAACIALPAALGGERRAIVALGLLAGLAYLTRLEAAYLAVAFLALGTQVATGWQALLRRGLGVALIAALVALPWWLRNLAVFGTPLPGQLADNALLTRNEQIFAYADPPTLSAFLGQGIVTIGANIVAAFRHDLVDVLLVPAAVPVVIGTLTLFALRRHAGALRNSPLAALLVLGSVTLVVTSVVFPVATLWGTFEHAAGPLITAMVVLAALGSDALVARVRAWRGWPRSNAWLAPAALIALALPLTVVQVSTAAAQARGEQQRFAELAAAVPVALDGAGVDPAAPIITDRPLWLSDALGRPALALPDEPADSVATLASRFGAEVVVVVEQRGRHPAALAAEPECFPELDLGPGVDARLFVIQEACR